MGRKSGFKLSRFVIKTSMGGVGEKQTSPWIYYSTLFDNLLLVPGDINRLIVDDRIDEIEECYLNKLVKSRVLLSTDIDELNIVYSHYFRNKYSTYHIDLTILLTYGCNFSCSYCFEKGLPEDTYRTKMSKERATKISDRIVDMLGDWRPKLLSVCYFGGEPTLNIEAIEIIQTKLNGYTKKNDIEFQVFMVSNGFKLNKENVDNLYSFGVRSYQITLDGPKDVHDKRRVLKSGAGTFDVLLENIKYIVNEKKLPIVISSNLDTTNQSYYPELLDTLEKNNLKNDLVEVIPGGMLPIRNDHDIKWGKDLMSDHQAKAVYKGFKLPRIARKGLCPYRSNRSLVIDPKGDLYKCLSLVGESDVFAGSIFDEYDPNLSYAKHAGNDTWTKHKECLECPFLPMCWGGCRYRQWLEKKTVSGSWCQRRGYQNETDNYLKYKLFESRFGKTSLESQNKKGNN